MGFTRHDVRKFDITGDIVTFSKTVNRGAEIMAESTAYSNVRSQYLNPLKTDTSEVYEGTQEVSKLRASWKIRNNSAQTITADNMAYKVGSAYHMITGVRKFKGDRNLLVLDTILRDNQTV